MRRHPLGDKSIAVELQDYKERDRQTYGLFMSLASVTLITESFWNCRVIFSRNTSRSWSSSTHSITNGNQSNACSPHSRIGHSCSRTGSSGPDELFIHQSNGYTQGMSDNNITKGMFRAIRLVTRSLRVTRLYFGCRSYGLRT